MTISSYHPGGPTAQAAPQQPLSSSLLRPCHVCHRRPTTRALISAFIDCDLCHQRACYVCLRECESDRCNKNGDKIITQTSSSAFSHGVQELLLLRKMYGCGGGEVDIDLDLMEEIDSQQRTHQEPRKVCSKCAVEGVTDQGHDLVWCFECFRQHQHKNPDQGRGETETVEGDNQPLHRKKQEIKKTISWLNPAIVPTAARTRELDRMNE